MSAVKALREQRGKLTVKMRAIVDGAEKENRDLSAEEEATFKQLHDDDVSLVNRIDRLEKLSQRESDLSELDPRGKTLRGAIGRDFDGDERETRLDARRRREQSVDMALGGWVRASVGKRLSEKERKALKACRASASQKVFKAKISKTVPFRQNREDFLREQRGLPPLRQAMTTTAVTTGGGFIPTGFSNRLERSMLAFGGMLSVAEVITTERVGDFEWPTTDDTSNEGTEIAQNTAADEQNITVGQVVFGAHKYTSKLVLIPTELLEDSPFDVAGLIGENLGERLGRILNRRCTTGTGAAQPFGIVEGATTGKTTASSTAITADEILDFIHSVDPAYRPQSSFMFHDNILLAVRKLKGSDNNYLWQPGLGTGVPDKLAGYPYFINQHMASSIATTAKTMLFGDLSKYKIRIVRSVRIKRMDERYGEKDQVGFVGFMRIDGKLIDAGTHPVKRMVQV